MIARLFAALCGICLISCSKPEAKPDAPRAQEDAAQDSSRAEEEEAGLLEFVAGMSLEDKAAQIFLLNLEGNEKFRAVEWRPDGRPLIPGGYLYFSYNIGRTAEQTRRFVSSVREFCAENGCIAPYAAVDQEGGWVNRLRGVTSPLDSQMRVAEENSVQEAEELYSSQAAEMAALGFDLNLAPVAEPLEEANRDFLDDRSFGPRDKAMLYSAAAVRAYQGAGVGAVLKHFPGNTNTDPHTGLPELSLSAQELEEQIVSVFEWLVRFKPEGILMSHARTAAFDAGTPACLSQYWVGDVLRKRFGYDGLVISDDIFMAALNANGFPPDKASVAAVSAGVDVLMMSEKKIGSAAKAVIEKAECDADFARRLDESVMRILRFKARHKILTLEQGDGKEAE